MLEGKNILVMGARAGGYGESLADAAVKAGATVFGTTLTPDDSREQAFFKEIGATLIDIPLRFDMDRRDEVRATFRKIEAWLRQRGVDRLDGVVHAVAGGFPRHPAVMKAVGDIIKGKLTFNDLATAVKRNVYYVNATSFEDSVEGLSGLCHDDTVYVALSYRGSLPYFISPTKKSLEKSALRMAGNGKKTLIAALPEAWTQSSQFFKGIEIGVLNNYLEHLGDRKSVAQEFQPAFERMEEALAEIEDLDTVLAEVQVFINQNWQDVKATSDPGEVSARVDELFKSLRKEGTFPILRRSVEAISAYVRDACGIIVAKEFLDTAKFSPGDVRQVYYNDLAGETSIGLADPRPVKIHAPSVNRRWIEYDRDEIRKTLSMYGANFTFLDRVIMEDAELYDGFVAFAKYTVPTPEENPILKDHFVDMPLFGGHLQMEAVAQFGTFAILKLNKGKNQVPILTGTEFPDLNTMAPPGEVLTMSGIIHLLEKRHMALEAFIENRYARSKGMVRGMILAERVVRKMMSSFARADED